MLQIRGKVVRKLVAALFGAALSLVAQVPSATLELAKFGYRPGGSGKLVDATDVTFLFDDLLLISINQRRLGPGEPRLTDLFSTLVAFDLKRDVVAKTVMMRVSPAQDRFRLSAEDDSRF